MTCPEIEPWAGVGLDLSLNVSHSVPRPWHASRSVVVLPRERAEEWEPRPGEVAISIANPRQSRAMLSRNFSDVLALGFHDADREGGGFTTMTPVQARAVLTVALGARDKPFMVHCQAGASRSVGIALFLAAWLRRPLEIVATDVLVPNAWVINQLRAAAIPLGLRTGNLRLLHCAALGTVPTLARNCSSVRTGAGLHPLTKFL